jgi:hypothetical protein
MNAWEEVQRRLRSRRDRLEAPSPAHDLLIAREDEGEGPWTERIELSGPFGEAVSCAMLLAEELERLASTDGSLWTRQQADEALSFALRLAGHPCERKGVTP